MRSHNRARCVEFRRAHHVFALPTCRLQAAFMQHWDTASALVLQTAAAAELTMIPRSFMCLMSLAGTQKFTLAMQLWHLARDGGLGLSVEANEKAIAVLNASVKVAAPEVTRELDVAMAAMTATQLEKLLVRTCRVAEDAGSDATGWWAFVRHLLQPLLDSTDDESTQPASTPVHVDTLQVVVDKPPTRDGQVKTLSPEQLEAVETVDRVVAAVC